MPYSVHCIAYSTLYAGIYCKLSLGNNSTGISPGESRRITAALNRWTPCSTSRSYGFPSQHTMTSTTVTYTSKHVVSRCSSCYECWTYLDKLAEYTWIMDHQSRPSPRSGLDWHRAEQMFQWRLVVVIAWVKRPLFQRGRANVRVVYGIQCTSNI